ncbi:hypothetical protein, partial [Streptomyces sp. CNQ085]|uniref:hypothetical protein n=1 Tax=Streptomyces sp. CNQ085 TaxID=2886944 RepID=UPI001F51364A
TGPAGPVTLPLEITEMPDRVVWLPLNSTGSGVLDGLGTVPGRLVKLSAAPAAPAAGSPQETKGVEA